MQIDKITQQDLSIFHHEDDQSVFHHLNMTTTNSGRNYFRQLVSQPLNTVEAIIDTQQTIQHLLSVMDQWPESPSNGTIMVMEKYYESPVETYPNIPDLFNSAWYRFYHKADYSLTLFTVQHAMDFLKGMQLISQLTAGIKGEHRQFSQRIQELLNREQIQPMLQNSKDELTSIDVLKYARFIRFQYKSAFTELAEIHAKLDAYLGMAKAGKKFGFCLPEIISQPTPYLAAEGLYHFMLQQPVDYTIQLSMQEHFLFLTGANMAGKSTFIKAVGLAVYLAHIGMGVPAKKMRLTCFDGLLTNIQILDNLARGESFFFNEVQRIKNTIEKISDGKKWLILIDELFKGTNQEDAVKCSTIVIEGLLKMNNALFVLSTHLYEIGAALKQYQNIQFRFFETAVSDGQLVFNYQLREGISNDRLGYLILKREGVVAMLEKL